MQGILPCEAAAGARGLFSGPYLCWFDTPTTAKIALAHRAILEFIQTHGPFDGVMGFSQGAAIAASILLHCEAEQKASPFRFAIFICSPLPFSHSLAHGVDTRTAFGVPSITKPVRPGCPDTVPPDLVPDSRYLQGEQHQGSSSGEETFYQMFLGSVDTVRISARTGHVIGAHDEWRRHSESLVELCVKKSRTVLYHQGGHEIPETFSEELCDLIETLVMESEL